MLVETVRKDMVQALKDGDKEKKSILSLLVAALDKGAKENQIVLKMCKQIQETIDTCPVEREDIKNRAVNEYQIISVYAPKMMSKDDIAIAIFEVLNELGIDSPTVKDKGIIMKTLMPKVRGKADGKLVNTMLSECLK